jgi:putative hemolysin
MTEQNQLTRLDPSPFLLNGALPFGKLPLFGCSVESVVEQLAGLEKMHRMYRGLPRAESRREFLEYVFDLLQIRYKVYKSDTSGIPAQGSAIIVANHPFGALEGLILAHILLGIRSDVRILANELLGRVPELKELFIEVDVFGGAQANRKNVAPMKKAIRWVNEGGLLLVFPAGEVSHFQFLERKITDPKWSKTVGRMVRSTQAPVIPVHIQGNNSVLFQTLGLIHPRLRTVMLPRQFLNKQNSIIDLRIGKSISFNKLKQFADDDKLTEYLRLRTYTLKNLRRPDRKSRQAEAGGAQRHMDAIANPVNSSLLMAEIANLSVVQCLAENSGLKVYYASAEQIPWILLEIGRLREISFRQTGEGTGKSVDLDLFDDYYLHLFVWNEEAGEIVCAYRMGLADQILEKYGMKGLYSYTLFKYSRHLLDSINPSIELGRSFVRPEYQRNFSPLMLLWKGIGCFVALHPRYRVLFGPVTISNDYETVSQQLLVDFLKMNNYDTGLARFVKPRKPFKKVVKTNWKESDFSLLQDIDHVSELVSQFEHDEKGAPILLKQYLKLGGTILGFNVDNQFSDALDGLIMVDLAKTDAKVLRRYMGPDQTVKFLNYHRSNFLQAS